MKHLILDNLFKPELEDKVFISEPFNTEKPILTYAQFSRYVMDVVNDLKQLRPSVIALQADNSAEWVAIDFACQLLEKVCIPIPSFFSSSQALHCLRSAGVDLFLSDAPILDDALPVMNKYKTSSLCHIKAYRLNMPTVSFPEGTQKVTFTSGSTGQPKGVCLSIDNQWQVAKSLADRVGINACHHVGILPFSTLLENIAGIYSPLLTGGQITILSEQRRGLSGSSGMNLPVLLNALSETNANSMILFPEIVSLLIMATKQGWKVPESFKFIAVGGAKVAADLIEKARASGLPIYQGYGLSECGSVVALSSGENSLSSVGDILPHVSVRLEQGEIIVTGNTFLGYLNRPESWNPTEVRTGDLGVLRAEGKTELSVYGRNSHLIISSFGRNISPEWVESELCSQPLFTKCVVGGSDRPHLFALVSAPDFISHQNIQDHLDACQSNLPDYAQVKLWHRLEESEWEGLYTDNGRPKRSLINETFKRLEESLYRTQKIA